MLERFFFIKTNNPELATRGRMLKGAIVILTIGVLALLPLVLTTPAGANAPAPPSVIASILLSELALFVIAFAMAHYGHVALGGMLLNLILIAILPLTMSSGDIISGRALGIYVIYILIAGLVIGARATLLFAGLALVEVGLLALLSDAPGDNWTLVSIALLVMATGLIWLIMRTNQRWLDYARSQTDTARAAQQDLAAREQSLLTTNQELQASNSRMEALLGLVRDLETPVIPVLDGVLVVPLVGYLDTQRAGHIHQTVLEAVASQRTEIVIIDITGISIVDPAIIRRIDELAQSIRLLGAQVILTGIHAEVACLIVDHGIALANIRTVSRLQDGIAGVLAERAAVQPTR